jgi:GTP-binding protein EngB required for normal cell division
MYKDLISSLSVCCTEDVNQVVRWLGRRRQLPLVLDLLDEMRAHASTRPNQETIEFLANAAVLDTQLVSASPKSLVPMLLSHLCLWSAQLASARAMKDLPTPDASLPEAVFAGRSNVGKSSLVNMICNRKAQCTLTYKVHSAQHSTFI